MPNEILVNYEEVYAKVAELRTRIQTGLQEIETTYRQATTTLNQMDSQTNAALIETIEEIRVQNQVSAETLTKLLTVIESSAQQVERDEAMIARAFTISRANTQSTTSAQSTPTPRNGGRP